MSTTTLRGAAPALGLVAAPPPAARARQLFAEARAASLDHLRALDGAMARLNELLDAIADGGELYAPGLRDFAGRLAEELSWKSRTLQMLSRRQADSIRG
jgi:hypothetical protein